MNLVVIKAIGLVTIQDRGRPGRMHEALPPGGALVPSMLARANRAVGNPDDAAAIEVCGHLVVRAERDARADVGAERGVVRAERDARATEPVVHVATDREARELRVGEELVVASDPQRVAYLAVRGGIDAPIVLGGRGAQLSAGLGALIRAGDQIATGAGPAGDTSPSHPAGFDPVVRILCGPDVDAFAPGALDILLAHAWRISSSSDRVGTRLEGPVIERRATYEERSRPMVIGAIEVPRDGAPIVLGPEHPTTGGYPIIAVVASDALDALHSIRLGGTVRFRL